MSLHLWGSISNCAMATALYYPIPLNIANWLALSSILPPHAQTFLRQSTFSVSLCTLLPQCIMQYYFASSAICARPSRDRCFTAQTLLCFLKLTQMLDGRMILILAAQQPNFAS